MKGKNQKKSVKKPKTAVKGKRYRCAICKKLSPKPVLSAPYYCPEHTPYWDDK